MTTDNTFGNYFVTVPLTVWIPFANGNMATGDFRFSLLEAIPDSCAHPSILLGPFPVSITFPIEVKAEQSSHENDGVRIYSRN